MVVVKTKEGVFIRKMNINNPKNDTRKSSLANMETWINESVVKA
jgi:hypothetical protein